MDKRGSLRSPTIVATKAAVHFLYGIGWERGGFEKYTTAELLGEHPLDCSVSKFLNTSLLCAYSALKVQIIFQFRSLILSTFVTL